MVQKVENVGKAIDSYAAVDDRLLRCAEEHRTQAGVLGTDDVPSGVVTDKDPVRRRYVYQFQRTLKRGRMWLPPANVSAKHRRINPLEEPVTVSAAVPGR